MVDVPCECCRCWKLTPCEGEIGAETFYSTTADLEAVQGLVIRIDGVCYSVTAAHGVELDEEASTATRKVYRGCEGETPVFVETVDSADIFETCEECMSCECCECEDCHFPAMDMGPNKLKVSGSAAQIELDGSGCGDNVGFNGWRSWFDEVELDQIGPCTWEGTVLVKNHRWEESNTPSYFEHADTPITVERQLGRWRVSLEDGDGWFWDETKSQFIYDDPEERGRDCGEGNIVESANCDIGVVYLLCCDEGDYKEELDLALSVQSCDPEEAPSP